MSPENDWKHYVIDVKDGKKISFWVDNQPVASQASLPLFIGAGKLRYEVRKTESKIPNEEALASKGFSQIVCESCVKSHEHLPCGWKKGDVHVLRNSSWIMRGECPYMAEHVVSRNEPFVELEHKAGEKG